MVGWQKLTEALLSWQIGGDEPPGRTASAKHALLSWLMLALVTPACAPDPDEENLRASIQAVYDDETGRLRTITYDSDQNGMIDTWTYMDGTTVLRVEVDQDKDGTVDRWEYFDEAQQLEKVGFSRANDGVVDAWAYEGPDGQIEKFEISTVRAGEVDRWEYYENDLMVRAEEDVSGDGQVDKWETYADGALVTAGSDENADGRPDRRLTYGAGGRLLTIETDPDPTGSYVKTVIVADVR